MNALFVTLSLLMSGQQYVAEPALGSCSGIDRFSVEGKRVCDLTGARTRIIPNNVHDANVDLADRKLREITAVASNYPNGIVPWYEVTFEQKTLPAYSTSGALITLQYEKKVRKGYRSLRIFAAKALQLMYSNPSAGDVAEFRARLDDWASKVTAYAVPGTDLERITGVEGDYDMAMRELMGFVHKFKDPKYRAIVSDLALERLVMNGIPPSKFVATDLDNYLGVYNKSNTQPETENHILMTGTSIYLLNQFLKENPRGSSVIAGAWLQPGGVMLQSGEVIPRPSRVENAGTKLEDLLLQAMGRVVHCDYFEQNGRPYNMFSVQSMADLFEYSTSEKVRAAAQNALDYTFARWAFSSYKGKRITPFRRNQENLAEWPMLDDDGVTRVMAMLSGVYSWDENMFLSETNVPHEFWLLTGTYRIPDAIHEFFLAKDNRFSAYIFPAYTTQHYRASYWPQYYSGTYPNGKFNTGRSGSAPEYYFAGGSFMNVSQGVHRSYPVDPGWVATLAGVVIPGVRDQLATAATELDTWARQNVILSSKPGYWKTRGDLSDLSRFSPLMPGNWEKANPKAMVSITTYKSFTLYYALNQNPKAWPFVFPADWAGKEYRDGNDIRQINDPRNAGVTFFLPRAKSELEEHVRSQTPIEEDDLSVGFRFFDLTNDPNYGYYLVACRYILKNLLTDAVMMEAAENSPAEKALGYPTRGFWEVVPKARFQNVAALKEWVLANNPYSNFLTQGRAGFPIPYKMTTNDKVTFWGMVGWDAVYDGAITTDGAPWITSRTASPIFGVIDGKTGQEVPPYSYVKKLIDAAEMNGWPLLSVKEVDESYAYTGRYLAYSKGNGYVAVCNPRLNKSQIIDSRDYKNPTSKTVIGNACVDPTSSSFESAASGLPTTTRLAPSMNSVTVTNLLD